MSRRRVVAVTLLAIALVLWRPVLYPGAKAALLVTDIFSPSLVGTNVAERLTPPVRTADTYETFAALPMRVSWWRPGWGDDHPAILVVNGATPAGNDDYVTRQFAASLARAGYLVMLPEFPFLKEGRLDATGPSVIDAAFAALRGSKETQGQPVGVFGASVGAGLALVAAGRDGAIGRADYVAILGSYFDIDTYVASVASHEQRLDGRPATWAPSEEVKERLPPAVIAAVPEQDRDIVRAAFAAPTYDEALARLRSLSPAGRALLDGLSPHTAWSRVRVAVFWIHDPNDAFEPLAEAMAAQRAPRDAGSFELLIPGLLQHAAVSPSAKGQDAPSLIGELWRLVTFSTEVLRRAG